MVDITEKKLSSKAQADIVHPSVPISFVAYLSEEVDIELLIGY